MGFAPDSSLPPSDTRQGALTLALPDELIERIARRAAEIIVEQPTATPEPWLDVAAAARHLKISVSQVYSLCSTRCDFPRTKEGSRTYFRASQLDSWRENRGLQR